MPRIKVVTRPCDIARLPLNERMRTVKSALSQLGYSLVTYSAQVGGAVLIRVKPHTPSGQNSLKLPPSVLRNPKW